MKDALKEQLDAIGKSLSETMESFKTAETGEREKLAELIQTLQEKQDQLAEQIKERPSLPGVEAGKGESGKFSWGRAIQLVTGAVKFGQSKEHGYEEEVFKNTEKMYDQMPEVVKASINAASDAAGGFLIPMELMNDIIPEAEAQSVAQAMGVTTINGLQGNVSWPKDEGGITTEYIDTELEASGSESAPTFSSVEMRPHVLGAFVPLTWSMLNQPAIALDSWVRGRLATKLALREDLSIFEGDAANGEPRGVWNATGILNVDWSGDEFGPGTAIGTANQNISDLLSDMVQALADSNTLMGRLGWVGTPDLVFDIGKTKDLNSNLIFKEAIEALPNNLMSYPVRTTTQLTALSLMLGDWSKIIVGRWGGMALAASDETETNFRKLRRTVRAVLAHDVAVTEPTAFCYAANANGA